jgi:hypothetical protein
MGSAGQIAEGVPLNLHKDNLNAASLDLKDNHGTLVSKMLPLEYTHADVFFQNVQLLAASVSS